MSKTPNQVLASNLRFLRSERGWSQEVLAERCMLHRTYIGAIERGERNITLDTLHSISLAVGISSAELISQVRSAQQISEGADGADRGRQKQAGKNRS